MPKERLSHSVVAELSIDELLEEAQRTAIESIPANTRRAYATDWNHFRNWCQKRSRGPLPASPETVSAYLTALARTHSIATIRRRLLIDDLRKMVEELPGTLQGSRDRALVLLGFAGGLRRHELVALDV